MAGITGRVSGAAQGCHKGAGAASMKIESNVEMALAQFSHQRASRP
jgi:hypothetical protein